MNLLFRLGVGIVYLYILLPLIIVLLTSFADGDGFGFPPDGLSLRWYSAFFESPGFVHAFFSVSLVVASASAFIAAVLGTLVALGITRSNSAWRPLAQGLFLMPTFTPHLLISASLYMLLTRTGGSGTLFSLVLAHVTIVTPFVIRSVLSSLVQLDPRLEEAALSLGCTRFAAIVKVTLPLARPGIFAGAILGFLISLSDVNMSLFLAGPGTVTLPLHILSELNWDPDPTIAAASGLQILVAGLLLLFAQRFVGTKAII